MAGYCVSTVDAVFQVETDKSTENDCTMTPQPQTAIQNERISGILARFHVPILRKGAKCGMVGRLLVAGLQSNAPSGR